MRLAIDGGEPALREPLRSTNHIGQAEARAAYTAVSKYPLSGFLGGQKRGGHFVTKLEDRWADKFKVKHAIACNSATSGLLAACAACGIDANSRVIVPSFTMSATAAAPVILGAYPIFADCDEDYFCYGEGAWLGGNVGALLVTNLFGHPAQLEKLSLLCGRMGVYLIEDNAQAIGAKEGERYAGTIGSIGVFSLNVHKAIHAGEGGVCVTDDDRLADRLRSFVNHGELGGNATPGLNLRLTEYAAAIAIEQLNKLDEITAITVAQAQALTNVARSFPWLEPPKVRAGCTHVYYCWAAKLDVRAMHRDKFIDAINAEGFPFNPGYADPLYRLPAFKRYYRQCPNAEKLNDKILVTFENTLHSLTSQQIDQFGEALNKIQGAYL